MYFLTIYFYSFFMKLRFSGLMAGILAFSLAACGGGGGGGSTSTQQNNPAGNWLSFDPSSLSVTQYEGESESVSLIARSSRTFAAPFNVAIIDATGVISSQVEIAAQTQLEYRATLHTSSALKVGQHSTMLEVRVCEDAPATCAKPFPGSPWRVPLSVKVQAQSNLTALQAVEGLGAWSTYQGNAAHTGFVAASFDPAAFSRRWKVASQSSGSHRYPSAAIDNKRAFFVRGTTDRHFELVAVSEDTGEKAWTVDLGTLHQVNPPAAANGRVYVTSTGHSDTFLWIFDQATGAQLKKEAMSSQWPSYSAPTLLGTDLYTINGAYGGLSRYGDAEGKFIWHGPGTAYEGWSPSTDGRFVYSYSTPDNKLQVLDAADGHLAYTIGDPYPYSTYFTSSVVVLTDTGQAIVGAGSLMAFDLASRKRSWILSTSTTGTPAYGNGTIYALGANGRSLEAHAPATGNLLWTAALPEGAPYNNVIVTRNLAFVSSDTSTLALDLNTKKVVWTSPSGGSLAISARGVLYVLSQSGALTAVNLR
jgi:outer membrane protein assembly factor BamB